MGMLQGIDSREQRAPWKLSEMEGKDADWFLKYRDGVFKEFQFLESPKSQRDGSDGNCGFTDEP